MKRTRVDDFELESDGASSNQDDAVDSLEKLLNEAAGKPSDKNWDESCTFLRNLKTQSHPYETVLGAVYWVKIPVNDAINMPWFDNLTCRPHKNSLAPGKPKTFAVSYTNPNKPDWIGLPRFLGLSLFGNPQKDIRSLGLDALFTMTQDRKLRDYQERAVKACTNTLNEWGGATLIADCGAGKTAMALSIAANLSRKTLVLCNRSFLMHQWKHDIEGKKWTWADDNKDLLHNETPSNFRIKCESCKKKIISLEKTDFCDCGFKHISPWTCTIEPRQGWMSNVRVGWLQGADGIDTNEKDIVIASIESVSQCNYPSSILKEFGLVIIDEMHHLGALTLSQVLPKLPSRFVLGISATPDRVDGLVHVLYWLAGPTAFVYKRLPSITGVSGTVIVNKKRFNGGKRQEIIYKGGKLGFASMVSLLAQDEDRNNYILDLIRSLIPERKKILVVTSIVDHAKFLSSALNCIAIHGGCSPALIAQAKSESTKIVVATFQFLEEGYDDPRIDTLVMTLPRSRIQQVVGRCERTQTGKLVPKVFDVVDTFSIFEAMSWKRHAFYKSRGFTILSS